MDETLFIIVVILRLLEEFDVSIVGADTQGHLLGAQSLTRVQEKVGMDSGLRQAAYWACLRQEIYISLRYQHSVRLNLQLYKESLAVRPGDPRFSMACSATLHCAEAVQFAFGDAPRSRHRQLLDYNDRMAQGCVPDSLQPFYRAEAGGPGGGFPDIRYSGDDDTIAAQYFKLARILLVTHDPAIPKTGPANRRATRAAEDEVRRCVRTLCGVGLSNPTSPAAILIACMAILLCGDCFGDGAERRMLCGVLEFTERQRGWPTAAIQGQLKESWDWNT